MKSYEARIESQRFVRRCRKAFAADLILSQLIAYLIFLLLNMLRGETFAFFAENLNVFRILLTMCVVYILMDVLFAGRSPGKRMFGLRVCSAENGRSVDVQTLLLRNLPILILPVEMMLQLLLGASLGNRLTNTMLLSVEEANRCDKGDPRPEWMRVAERNFPTQVKVKIVIAAVLVFLAVIVGSLYVSTKTEAYALAYDYLLESEGYTEEDAPFVLLTGCTETTITYTEDQYKEHIVEYTFYIDGKMRSVSLFETETGFEIR